MLNLKGNLAKSQDGQTYDTVGVPVEIDGVKTEIGRIDWGEVSNEVVTSSLISQDTLLKKKKETKLSQAIGFLTERMTIGVEYHAGTLIELAKSIDISEDTLSRAYEKLCGGHKIKKADGWYWWLPMMGAYQGGQK